jgi:hypothetical protein
MKKQAIILLLFFVSISIFGQTFSKKYITYRSRFREDFLTKTNNPYKKANFIPIENITTKGQPIYADETWYLGFYLGVLSTEYKIKQLNKNTKGVKETANEIQNILITIDRLDSIAETYWDKPPKINGFFIRNDVGKKHNPMSQDQVWSLFYGYRLIKKFVDDSAIVKHTQEQTKRILNSLYPIVKEKPNKNKRKWIIVSPDKKVVQKNIEISVSKYAFAKTASYIVDSNIYPKGSKNIWAKFLFSASRARVYHKYIMRKRIHIYNTYGVTNLTVLSMPKKALKYSLKNEKTITKYFPEGSFAHFPLTAALLYGGKVSHNKEYYNKILTAAPMEGPNYKAAPPWNTLSIIACPWQNNANGRFNGLDYLLLHNLVELYFLKETSSN